MVLTIKHFLFAILQNALVVFPFLAQSLDQSGFISIDCGLLDVPSYTDETTGITYVSDANFTESGESKGVSPTYKGENNPQQFWNVRSFPDGDRNCYTLTPSQGKGMRYLIRASFMYGNYDNKNDQTRTFNLSLGVDHWDTIKIEDAKSKKTTEIIHVPSSDHIYVCLVNTGNGTPFISVLELRQLGIEFYTSKSGTSLKLHDHYDFSSENTDFLRYKDDVYDRLWYPLSSDQWKPFIDISSSDGISITKNDFQLPLAIMTTAYTGKSGTSDLHIVWETLDSSSEYFFYMHFAELEVLQSNQSREFNIYINDKLWYEEIVSPEYLKTETIFSRSGYFPNEEGKIDIFLNNTDNATLPPLINAMELYVLKELSGLDTNQIDVEAMWGVKSAFGIKRISWQGDPCGPEVYLWDGLKCVYTADNQSRIVSLNLSSSGLKGEIASSIANLTMLENLDLSNNNLTGMLPEFLAQLSFLKILNLKGNNLTGPIPDALAERSKNGLLLLMSLETNSSVTTSCSSGSCGKKKNFVVPLVASLSGLLLVVIVTVAVIWSFKRRKQEATDLIVDSTDNEDRSFVSKKQQFTYSEIGRITNNFERVLGEGGFGKVYHGYLNGIEVAVKMLSPSSIQGHRQFHAELRLLLRVHHKNLTSLIGYCNESTNNNIGLIYEYMAMGNLRSHLSDNSPKILSWENRLRIAVDTAQGLEYLHNGCKPPIVHRDVKSTNILLNEKFQAKLSDFGLSKIFPGEGEKHISRATSAHGISVSVAGTLGYLDPEYYLSNWLSEKSDVYSFGVVLLEIITARPVLAKTRETNHISEWVSSMLSNGDIDGIVDPRLMGLYDRNTVWKATEIAMACVSKTSTNRPTMSTVVTELKGCLTTESARKDGRDEAESKVLAEMISPIMTPEPLIPLAR